MSSQIELKFSIFGFDEGEKLGNLEKIKPLQSGKDLTNSTHKWYRVQKLNLKPQRWVVRAFPLHHLWFLNILLKNTTTSKVKDLYPKIGLSDKIEWK